MNTLDGIRSMHAASKIKLDACKETHKHIVEHINGLLISGQVEGVPFRLGETAEVSSGKYEGRLFEVESIFIKLVNLTGRYTVMATGAIILKRGGYPGTARGSAQHPIE